MVTSPCGLYRPQISWISTCFHSHCHSQLCQLSADHFSSLICPHLPLPAQPVGPSLPLHAPPWFIKKPRLLSPTVTALWCLVWLLLSCVSGSWNVACIYAHATSGKPGVPAPAQQDWRSFKTPANLLTLFVSPALEGCSFHLFLWAWPFYPVTAPPFCVFLCRRCLLTCLPHQSKEQALFLHLHHLASCLALRRCSTTVRLMNGKAGLPEFRKQPAVKAEVQSHIRGCFNFSKAYYVISFFTKI